jgi:hypothetical protein
MAQTRTLAIEALKTRMAVIDGTGSYGTTVVTVDSWRSTSVPTAEMPAIVVRDPVAEAASPEGTASPYNKKTWRLPVQLELLMNGATDVQIRTFIKDVYRAIGIDPTLGGTVIDCDQIRDRITYDQEDKHITGAIVEVELEYQTQKWQES